MALVDYKHVYQPNWYPAKKVRWDIGAQDFLGKNRGLTYFPVSFMGADVDRRCELTALRISAYA